jgi:hypothetical protein
MAFVMAAVGHTVARRRALVMAGGAGVGASGRTPARGAVRARTREKPDPNAGERDAVRAVGYVSGVDPPALAGPDVRKQIATIDATCDRHGWELTEIVRDVSSRNGGPSTPGLTYAVKRLVGAKPSCLVVAELGRLSESPGELGRIIRSLRERDVRLVAVNADLDTSTADGRLAADALISVGELEEQREPQNTRPAVQDLPALRKHIVAMRSAGMTLQAIADRLNAEGVPTLRGGKMWRPSSVQVAVGYRRPGQPRRAHSLPTGRLTRGPRGG